MSNVKQTPLPLQRALRKLGQDIASARKRRCISTSLMAERANMTRVTLTKIEKGNPGVSLGNYAMVLFVLGFTDRLADLVDFKYDTLGHELEKDRLPQRIRYRKTEHLDDNDNESKI